MADELELPKRRSVLRSPTKSSEQVLLQFGVNARDLSKLTESRRRHSLDNIIGIGCTAAIFIQVANYFSSNPTALRLLSTSESAALKGAEYLSENPHSFYTARSVVHSVVENWDTFQVVWDTGEFLGWRNLASACAGVAEITNAIAGYDLLDAVFDGLDLGSLGLGIGATILAKYVVNKANGEERKKLKRLESKWHRIQKVAYYAENSAPPAFIRRELKKLGSIHFVA